MEEKKNLDTGMLETIHKQYVLTAGIFVISLTRL